MANDLNQCNFIGRLGTDPEIKYLPQGGAVVNFSIACNWKSKDKEGSEWVKIVAYERLAEICGEYLRKGSKVFISGKLQTRKWTDQQGIERYTTEIKASDMQMLDAQPQGGKQPSQQQAQQPQAQQQPQRQRQAPPAGYQGQMPQQRQQRPQQQAQPQYQDFDDEINF